MLRKSRRQYATHHYEPRSPVASFHSRTSKHIRKAEQIYQIPSLSINSQLTRKTGCSKEALQQIVRKGMGAYYSSGSRPNQTAQSWGRARLASSITAGKAAAVDFPILAKGCKSKSLALSLAKMAVVRYGHGLAKTRKTNALK
jgi:hypothetical protein